MFGEADEREEGSAPSSWTGASTPFVGRQQERERIKTSLKRRAVQLVKIIGPPLVGKSRLADEVAAELTDESVERQQPLQVMKHSLRNKTASSLRLLRWKILQAFGSTATGSDQLDFGEELKELIQSKEDKYYLLLFDNCDDMESNGSRTSFIELIYSLVKTSPRIKIVITSRVKFKFTRIYAAEETVILGGLSDAESLTLLKRAGPNVDYGAHAQKIIDRCCCLPLLLIIFARILEEKRAMFSAEELCDVLEAFPLDGLSADLASDEDNMEHIISNFVGCLEDHHKRALALLSYFAGSFSAEGAAYVAECPKVAVIKAKALIPLTDRSFVDFDPLTSRFSILPVIRQYVNLRESHMRNTDAVRQRFCEFFGQLLIKADNNLCLDTSPIAVGEVYDEWPNVELMMREACQPSADLFHLNMQVVRSAADIINRLLPEQADAYYQSVRSAAHVFGTKFDIACIDSSLGATVGFVKGNCLQKAIKLLEGAEESISPATPYQYVKLMSHFEWNYYRQGKMREARQYQNRGLSIQPEGPDKQKLMRIQVNIRNHKALLDIFEGRPLDAVEQLRENIAFAKSHFKHHPAVRVMLNSLGLAYSELDDHAKAVMYCSASLKERRKYCSKIKRELVIPLSNLAGLLSKSGEYGESRNGNLANLLSKGGEYGIALNLISEAIEIREKLEWVHLDTATAVWSKGKILRSSGDFKGALEYLQEAFRLFKKCVDTHSVLAAVNVDIARCLKGLGRFQDAKELLRSTIDGRRGLEQNEQLNFYILGGYDCLLELSHKEGWVEVAKEKCDFLRSLLDADAAPVRIATVSLGEQLSTLEEKIAHESLIPENQGQACPKEKAEEHKQAAEEELLKKVSKLEGCPTNLKKTDKEKISGNKLSGVFENGCKSVNGRDDKQLEQWQIVRDVKKQLLSAVASGRSVRDELPLKGVSPSVDCSNNNSVNGSCLPHVPCQHVDELNGISPVAIVEGTPSSSCPCAMNQYCSQTSIESGPATVISREISESPCCCYNGNSHSTVDGQWVSRFVSGEGDGETCSSAWGDKLTETGQENPDSMDSDCSTLVGSSISSTETIRAEDSIT